MNRSEKKLPNLVNGADHGEDGGFHYLGSTWEESEKGKSEDRRNLKKFSNFGFVAGGIGFLLTLIALFAYSNGATNYDALFKTVGWGFLLVGTGFLIVFTRFCYTMPRFSSKRSQQFFMLGWFLGTTVLTVFNTFSFVLATTGVDFVCNPNSPAYDPDAGACPCDRRTLLRTDVTPVFDLDSDLPSLSQPLVVASIGDTDLSDGRDTFTLIKSKNPDLVVINGDLTYAADPKAFLALIDEFFEDEIPVAITVGNHDTGIYTEYQAVIQERYSRYLEATKDLNELEVFRCAGPIGVDQICSYKNLGFVFSGIGSTCGFNPTLKSNFEGHMDSFAEESLLWRTVFIHKNHRLLQTGGKTSEVQIETFQAALDAGAMMMNSHEHQVARTKELYSVGSRGRDFEFVSDEDMEFIEGKESIRLRPGSFGVVLNGLGGKSIRTPNKNLAANPWWSVVFNELSENSNFGAHFCEYNYKGNERLAHCYFETNDNVVIDEYFQHTLH